MKSDSCVACLKPTATLNCDVCGGSVCKKCAEFIGEDTFSFLDEIPECLSHRIYCRECFEQGARPEMEKYNRTMEAAKNVLVYSKTQGRETRHFSRKEDLFQVIDCTDHDEAILRLAFSAAKAGFNTIIDLEISSRKVRIGGYQHLLWSATARPAQHP